MGIDYRYRCRSRLFEAKRYLKRHTVTVRRLTWPGWDGLWKGFRQDEGLFSTAGFTNASGERERPWIDT